MDTAVYNGVHRPKVVVDALRAVDAQRIAEKVGPDFPAVGLVLARSYAEGA